GCHWLPSLPVGVASGQVAHHLMNVAPRPGGSRHHRAHHGVLRCLEVFGRVFAGRRIAAAHVATRLAFPQLHPTRSLTQALLARAGGGGRWKSRVGQPSKVFTGQGHEFLLYLGTIPGVASAVSPAQSTGLTSSISVQKPSARVGWM